MEPHLRQVIIEAWRDVADVDRSKQVKKITDITCILPSPSPLPPQYYVYYTIQVDCSKSPIFSWDRLDIPRLTVTAILLFKCIEGAGVRNYSQSTIQEHRRAYSWWNSTLPKTLESLSKYDGDGDGYENVSRKVTPRFFKFYQAYSISFSPLNVGELVWIWILKDCIEVQEKNKNVVVSCSRRNTKREIRKFHAVVVLWRQKNVQKAWCTSLLHSRF